MTLWPYPTTACGESRLIWKSQAASRTPNEVLDFWESAALNSCRNFPKCTRAKGVLIKKPAAATRPVRATPARVCRIDSPFPAPETLVSLSRSNRAATRPSQATPAVYFAEAARPAKSAATMAGRREAPFRTSMVKRRDARRSAAAVPSTLAVLEKSTCMPANARKRDARSPALGPYAFRPIK